MNKPANIPALLGICCFVSMAAMRACDTLLPALAADFNVTLGQAARVIFVFAIAYGVLQLVFGALGDRLGKLRVIAWCALSCVIGNAMAFFSPNLDWLVAARILSGACAAGVFPLALAWLGDNVPYTERQPALARLVSAGVLGMLAGQWLSGIIAEWVGWRAVFLVMSVLFLAAGGALLRAQHRETGTPPPPQKTLQTLRELLSSPACLWILAVVGVEGALAIGALAFIPSWLQGEYGVSLSVAGAIAACYGVGGFIYTRMARVLLGRIGESGLARLGGAALFVGLTSFVSVPWLAWTPLACLLAGFGFYGLHNTLQTHATQMAPHARGSAMALFACLLFVGQSVGIVAAAWVADHLNAATFYWGAGVGLLLLGLAVAQRGAPRSAH